MTKDEVDLLKWLGSEDVSQYGECYGKTLDSLVAQGFARVQGEETEIENPFIAKGRGIMFRAVSLTDVGREKMRSLSRNPA